MGVQARSILAEGQPGNKRLNSARNREKSLEFT
jgi:hypothetical protein